ncbi:unnamed protein product, partial [Ectocarpus sp. 4 AP-2014]
QKANGDNSKRGSPFGKHFLLRLKSGNSSWWFFRSCGGGAQIFPGAPCHAGRGIIVDTADPRERNNYPQRDQTLFVLSVERRR